MASAYVECKGCGGYGYLADYTNSHPPKKFIAICKYCLGQGKCPASSVQYLVGVEVGSSPEKRIKTQLEKDTEKVAEMINRLENSTSTTSQPKDWPADLPWIDNFNKLGESEVKNYVKDLVQKLSVSCRDVVWNIKREQEKRKRELERTVIAFDCAHELEERIARMSLITQREDSGVTTAAAVDDGEETESADEVPDTDDEQEVVIVKVGDKVSAEKGSPDKKPPAVKGSPSKKRKRKRSSKKK